MQHLEEGLIHAWIDGALPAAEASAVEAHVASCAECAAVVAEARGLVAASSRIISNLDATPGGVLPAFGARPVRRWTGSVARLSIAATLILAVGIFSARNRGAKNSLDLPPQTSAVEKVIATTQPPAPAPSLESSVQSATIRPRATIGPSPARTAAQDVATGAGKSAAEGAAGGAGGFVAANAAPPPAAQPTAPTITAPTSAPPSVMADAGRREVPDSARVAKNSAATPISTGAIAGGAARQARTSTAAVPQAISAQVAEMAPVRSFAGCYELEASADILPARFALLPDTIAGGLNEVRYVDAAGRVTDRILDAGWTIERGRAVVKTARRGVILSIIQVAPSVAAESVDGIRLGRLGVCR